MSFQELKEKSRQALHTYMARPASFYATAVADPPTAVTARRHDAPKKIGDLAGTNLSYAEVHERPTTVVLWRAELAEAELTLRRGALIIFAEDEGWFVDNILPPDGQTITAEVTPLDSDTLAGKQLPDGTVIGA